MILHLLLHFLPSDLVLCKEPFLQEQPLSHWILDLETDHCVKSVPIRSFLRSVFWRIWTEYNNIRIRKNSVFGLFNYEPTMFENSVKNLWKEMFHPFCKFGRFNEGLCGRRKLVLYCVNFVMDALKSLTSYNGPNLFMA